MNMATVRGFTPANGERDDVTNVMIVLTDGQDGRTQDVVDAYNAAKSQGDTVLAVGVGTGVNHNEMLAIVGGDASKVLDVLTFADLSTITGTICHDIEGM